MQSQTEDINKRITPEAVAENLGIPPTTLRKALKRGDCGGVDFGSRIGWRTSVAEALEWMDKLAAERAGKVGALDIERIAGRFRAVGMEKLAQAVESLPEVEAAQAEEAEAA